ncbi:phosphopantetheine-binding protein [Cohnella sp. REN36]|uniref:phosphopantetheine-binding protein n=1 Tax=Cohnella sp. REN36 TaxID=2887347 RepID=UPI001D14F0CC|nr:phosphopantetheine-binding protein [Cohnella sp. REN36]MCC3372468.1 phosphopantetheine-binding protein [Cohnella sp. REN36]
MNNEALISFEEIKQTVKEKLLVERLELEDVTPEEIGDDTPLFGEGLGLDSVEAFEVMVGLEAVFGVMVEGIPADRLREHLFNVSSIARFVEASLRGRADRLDGYALP